MVFQDKECGKTGNVLLDMCGLSGFCVVFLPLCVGFQDKMNQLECYKLICVGKQESFFTPYSLPYKCGKTGFLSLIRVFFDLDMCGFSGHHQVKKKLL